MNKKLSEPVTLIVISLALALLALAGGEMGGDMGPKLFVGAVALAGIGGVWWLTRGHIAHWKATHTKDHSTVR